MRLLVVVFLIILFVGMAIFPTHTLNVKAQTCISPTSTSISSPTPPPPVDMLQHHLFINEILLASQHSWNCNIQDNQPTPLNGWLELYNTTDQPINLGYMHTYLSINANTQPYYFDQTDIVPAHGFLALFAGTYNAPNQAEINTLQLFVGGTLIDQVNIPTLANETSYARIPDGSNNWEITSNPTIASSNQPSTSTSTPTATLTPAIGTTLSTHKKALTGSSQTTGGNAKGTQPQDKQTQPDWKTMNFPGLTPTPVQPFQKNAPSPDVSNTTRMPGLLQIVLIMSVILFAPIAWYGYKFLRKTLLRRNT